MKRPYPPSSPTTTTARCAHRTTTTTPTTRRKALTLLLTLLVTNTHNNPHINISNTFVDATSSIPRSTNARSIDPNNHHTNNSKNNNKNGNSCSTSGSSSSSNNNGNSQSSSLPPWNPSPKIDPDGFLTDAYTCVPGEWEPEANIGGKHTGLTEPVRIRQVPGDGNCLFHSISVALAAIVNQTHIDMAGNNNARQKQQQHRNKRRSIRSSRSNTNNDFDEEEDDSLYDEDVRFDLQHLHHHSTYLRQRAVDILSLHPRRLLFLQGNEYLRARDLVDAAAAQYDLKGEEYCELMRKESYWGGGPEIVALCNVLRRPIHVYELSGGETEEEEDGEEYTHHPARNGAASDDSQRQFRLRRMACFGSPKFDRREPLHILSADSRFPDVSPGEQLSSGNHFLALFPDECIRAMEEARGRRRRGWRRRRRSAGVRGGGSSGGDGVEVVGDGGRRRRVEEGMERSVNGGRNSIWGRMMRCIGPVCGGDGGEEGDGPLNMLIQFAIRLFLRV